MSYRTIAGTLAAVIGTGALSLAVVKPAQARSEDMWRAGTYVGAGGLAYGLARGNSTIALIGAGVGLLSYSQWRHEMARRHRWEHGYGEYCGYRTAWYRHHRRPYYGDRYHRVVVVHDYGYRPHGYHGYRHHYRGW